MFYCPFTGHECNEKCALNTGNGCSFFGIYTALERIADALEDEKDSH